MAWFNTGEAMGTLNAIGRDANNFIKRTIEEIEKDFARVEVNVGAPGIRFGQSRNRGSPGTSEEGSMGSEPRSLPKKAMACEGCSTKFSVWRRKHSLAWIRWARFSSVRYRSTGLRECMECKRMYCSQCLPKVLGSGAGSGGWCSRERRQTTCSRCLVLLAQPPSRSALLGLRTRDLQAFLASRKVPTHWCLEKDDLVNLVIQLSNNEVNGDSHINAPYQRGQFPSNNQYPPNAEPERRHTEDIYPRSEVDGAPPYVHSFNSRSESHSFPNVHVEEHHPHTASRGPASPRDSLYPQIPTEDTTQTVDESVLNYVPPSAPPSEPNCPSGSSVQTEPPRSNLPSSSEEGDWEMVEPEDVAPKPTNLSPPSNGAAAHPFPQTNSADTNTSLPSRSAEENSFPLPGSVDVSTSLPSSTANTNSYPPPRRPPRSPARISSPQHISLNVNSSTPPTSPEVNLSQLPETPAANSSPSPRSAAENISPTSNRATVEPEETVQSSSANPSPSFNRAATSTSEGSSPSKLPGPFQIRGDIASSILSSTTSVDDLSSLTVKQLKALLTSSRVDYHGCCEKKELLERAQRLWREYKAVSSHENLSDDTMCKVCMDAPIDCVMLECGHMATCTHCGKRMSECPICRQYVVRIVRTFKA